MNEKELLTFIQTSVLDTSETRKYQAINFKDINWLENPYNHTSFIFILHKMDYIYELALFAMKNENGGGALDMMYQILLSWEETCLNKPDHIVAFHDHATAIRASNFAKTYTLLLSSHFALQYQKLLLLLQKLLHFHALKLSEENFYSKHTNHGFDQAMCLYELSFCLKEKSRALKSKELALKRINDELDFAFLNDGSHRENSPSYHIYGLLQLQRALLLTLELEKNTKNIKLSQERFDKSLLFLGFIIQPNLLLPLIGDSTSIGARDFLDKRLHFLKTQNYEKYLYLISNGKRGIKPNENTFFANLGGYVIFKDIEKLERGLHFVFKNGFKSTYHRHDDDLSFTLFYDQEEWLLDGGLFEYAESNAFRKYLRSYNAHNISSPIINANRNLKRGEKTIIYDFKDEDNTLSFKAKSFMFDGFINEREVKFDKKRHFFHFKDSCSANNKNGFETLKQRIKLAERTYATRFIIPSDKKIHIDSKNAHIIIKGQRTNLHIVFKNSIQTRLVKGLENPVQGFISRKLNELEKVYFLEINHFSKTLKCEFVLYFSQDEKCKKYFGKRNVFLKYLDLKKMWLLSLKLYKKSKRKD